MTETAEKVRRYLAWITATGGRSALESTSPAADLLEGVTPGDISEEAFDAASTAARKIEQHDDLDEEDVGVLEAIIIPGKRPVVDIIDGTYTDPPGEFAHFGQPDPRTLIEAAIPSVGRIELPDHPSLPFGGTGFLVGDGLLMTNRHVAELFAIGVGRDELSFRSGQTADIDFLEELGNSESATFHINRIVMVHPYWDMALLAVVGLAHREPLTLTVAPPDDLRNHDVAVIGYPAFDRRNDVALQNEIFRGVFDVKRLHPGRLRERADVKSFGHQVMAVTHDSSTLGGNSGSAVIDVTTGKVVALHFGGRYLEANYAVPAHDLALDRYVADAGVHFDGELAGADVPWSGYWSDAQRPRVEHRLAAPMRDGADLRPQSGNRMADGEAVTWTVPIEITVRVGTASPGAAAAPALDAGVERVLEPMHDVNLSARTGYDENFLGIRVPLPDVVDPGVTSKLADDDHVLRYEHFSVVMHRERRLALFSASNVDASPLRKEPEDGHDYTRRGLAGLGENDTEKWFTDPRIPATHQLPDRFYNKDRQAFDKGHIVRRDDAAWGDTFEEVRRANGDTYHVTNCSPQVSGFNRKIWLQLENLILKQADDERLCVLTGPVFADDDPDFDGEADDGPIVARIPRQYWKVAVAKHGDRLESFAFLLEQDLSAVAMTAPTSEEFVVPSEWRGRMVSVGALEQLLEHVRFAPELHDADQFGQEHGERIASRAGIESMAS